MLTSLLLLLPGLASSTSLRQHASDFSTRIHEVEEILLKPSAWSIYPPPPLPPRFLIVTSPQERIVSYSQIGDDYSAVKGLVKPLIQGGVDLPKGVAFDARHNRLFVADPGLKRIKAWTLSLERCLSPAEKAGLLGTGASSDPFVTDDAEGPTRCDLPWTLRASEEVTVLADVFSEWVSLDHNGNLYYSDQDRKSVNKIEAGLLLNLVHGEVAPSDVSRRSASRAASEKLVEEGKEAMQIVDKAHDPLAFAADPMGSAGDGLKAGAELVGNMAKSAAALAPDLPLTTVGDTSVMELFQASESPHVATPGGVVSDTVQVYWSNENNGFEKGAVATGFADPESSPAGAAQSSKLTSSTDRSYGIAATTSAIIFSDGGGVYGVSKYGGGNATALNDGFILARGLAFDGSGTVFVADEGASTVFAMPCSILTEGQPLHPVLSMHGVFGIALIQPSDPMVAAVTGAHSGAAARGFAGLAALAAWMLLG
mmetsp:Transcript_59865/g.139997  ORF Transcript_59865/g.139997 Transcript_59865/m.139997 type:complete len:483 (+) Transcript_59865:88-1536(+)